jgi:hypothetical protein
LNRPSVRRRSVVFRYSAVREILGTGILCIRYRAGILGSGILGKGILRIRYRARILGTGILGWRFAGILQFLVQVVVVVCLVVPFDVEIDVVRGVPRT